MSERPSTNLKETFAMSPIVVQNKLTILTISLLMASNFAPQLYSQQTALEPDSRQVKTSALQDAKPPQDSKEPKLGRPQPVSYVGIQLRPYSAIMPLLDKSASAHNNQDMLSDHQRFTTYLSGEYLAGRSGITIAPTDYSANLFSLTSTADARADVIMDSAKLNKPTMSFTPAGNTGFFPSLIPVRGNASYGLGDHANIFQGDSLGNLAVELNGKSDVVGDVRAVTDLTMATQTNGQTGVQFLHVYGQVYNFIIGKTDSTFSDPHVLPNTLDVVGPNAEINVQHAMLGYMYAVYQDTPKNPQTQLIFQISMESPETSATPLDGSSSDATHWNSRTRIPDFAANIRLIEKSWGHLQIAAIFRDVGIENEAYNENLAPTYLPPKNVPIAAGHEDAFGWGVHITGALHPFDSTGLEFLSHDRITFGTVFGAGISNYISDLRAVGGYDAMYNVNKQFKAVQVNGYWAGYTHFWTARLSSTIAISELNADTFVSPGFTGSPYRRGWYYVANLIYAFQTPATKQQDGTYGATGDSSAAKTGNVFTGLEFLYGERETLNGVTGTDQRIQFTVGVRF
jgi:hypothetical protein